MTEPSRPTFVKLETSGTATQPQEVPEGASSSICWHCGVPNIAYALPWRTMKGPADPLRAEIHPGTADTWTAPSATVPIGAPSARRRSWLPSARALRVTCCWLNVNQLDSGTPVRETQIPSRTNPGPVMEFMTTSASPDGDMLTASMKFGPLPICSSRLAGVPLASYRCQVTT